MSLLFWSLPAVAIVHIGEEFVFPGGFKAWYQAYMPETAASVTDLFLVLINAALIAFSINVALVGPTPIGVRAWLTLAALLFSNAVFHVIGTWQTRRYSPGVVSGLLLYIPLAIYGFFYFLRDGKASAGVAVLALIVGSSYHIFLSLNHRMQVRMKQPR